MNTTLWDLCDLMSVEHRRVNERWQVLCNKSCHQRAIGALRMLPKASAPLLLVGMEGSGERHELENGKRSKPMYRKRFIFDLAPICGSFFRLRATIPRHYSTTNKFDEIVRQVAGSRIATHLALPRLPSFAKKIISSAICPSVICKAPSRPTIKY